MRIGDISWFDERENLFNRNIIKLELSASCNASCVFCHMFRDKRKSTGFMSFENLIDFIHVNGEYLQSSHFEIEPFFNGETLIHPRCLDMMEEIANANITLGELDTNFGMRINIPRLARLPLRRITVNIGGLDSYTNRLVMNTDLEQALNNVKALMEDRRRTFDVCMKMNPVRANIHQLGDMDSFVRNIHPELHWKAQKTGLPVPTDLSHEERAIFIRNVYTSERPDLFRFQLDGLGVDSVVPRNFRCLYMTPCVNSNGSVTLCAHDQLRHFNFGNAFHDHLEDIFASADYQLTMKMGRQRGLEICHGCN